MLASTCPETENHLDECRTTNGAILRCTVRKKTLWCPVCGNVLISPVHFMVVLLQFKAGHSVYEQSIFYAVLKP